MLVAPLASPAVADDAPTDLTLVGWGLRANLGAEIGSATTIAKTPLDLGGVESTATAAAVAQTGSLILAPQGVYTVGPFGGVPGLGEGVTAANPTLIPDTAGAVAIAAGGTSRVIVRGDGTVWAFGTNSYGELGGTIGSSAYAPRQVEGISDVVAVASAQRANLALRSDGTVWAWGESYLLGSEAAVDAGNTATPVQVNLPAGRTATKIVAGADYALALLDDGSVAGWGRNQYGPVGNGTKTQVKDPAVVLAPAAVSTSYPSAVALNAGVTVTDLAAGISSASYAVLSDGDYLAWGRNTAAYPLGLGSGSGETLVPTAPVDGLPDHPAFVEIVVNFGTVLARTVDGEVYAWGAGTTGLLGNGSATATFDYAYPYTGAEGTSGQTVTEIPQRIPKLSDVPWLAEGIYGRQQIAFSNQSLKFSREASGRISFSSQAVGTTSASREVTLDSIGDPSTITRVQITGTAAEDFQIFRFNNTDPSLVGGLQLPHEISAGGGLDLRLRFTPTEAGERHATLSFISDGETASIPLEGYGTELPGNIPGPEGPEGPKGDPGKDGKDGSPGVVALAAAQSTVKVKRGKTATLPFVLVNGTSKTVTKTTLKAKTPSKLRVTGKKTAAVAATKSGKVRAVKLKLKTRKSAKLGTHKVTVSAKIAGKTVKRTVKVRVTR